MKHILQLAQDYEDCLRLDMADEEVKDKELKRDVKKIQKIIKKLRKISKRYNKILK